MKGGKILSLVALISLCGCGGKNADKPGGGGVGGDSLACLRAHPTLREIDQLDAAQFVGSFAVATRECGSTRAEALAYGREMESVLPKFNHGAEK